MKFVIALLYLIGAIVITSIGFGLLSQPSNTSVFIGVVFILCALVFFYLTVKTLLKK